MQESSLNVNGLSAELLSLVQPLEPHELTATASPVVAEPVELAVDTDEADAEAVDESVEATEPTVDHFAELGLAEPLLMAVRDLGYTMPTAVQMRTIPLAMPSSLADALPRDAEPADDEAAAANLPTHRDLMVSSQTGSGKTAAFLLPLLQGLHLQAQARDREAKAERERLVTEGKAPPKGKRPFPMNPRNFKAVEPGALVLCPTRELAQQVANDAIDLARHLRGVRVAVVVGGLPYQMQIARLQGAALVIATPGRLLDLQRSNQIRCESVQCLVLDEADRMLDLGFADDLAEIHGLTEQRRQTMMFSATFEPRIQQLARRVMREPERITVDTPQESHANIRKVLYWADNPQHKRALLDHLMRDTAIAQAIVFASTQVECDSLASDLQQSGFHATALHGALSQGLRNRRLGLLREGHIQFLVATDVAARGIDVPGVSHVFNYGLPMKAEDYVHRIGRTGRAGRDGLAITLAEHRDRRKVADIEYYTKQQLETQTVAGMEPTPQKAKPRTKGKKTSDRPAPSKPWKSNAVPFEPRHEPRQEPRHEARAEQRHEPRQDQRFDPRFDPRFDARGQGADQRDQGGESRGQGPAPRGYGQAPRGYGHDARGQGTEPRGYGAARPARPHQGQPFAARDQGAAPFGGGKPFAGKPFGDKPFAGKSFAGKPFAGKSFEPRAHDGANFGGKPAFGKPFAGKPFGDKPFGDKPFGGKPAGAKPFAGKPFGAKAGAGGKPFAGKPFGAKPFGAKPAGAKGAPAGKSRAAKD